MQPDTPPIHAALAERILHTFEQAHAIAITLPANSRDALLARLDRVRNVSHNLGYGVGDEMDSILAEYT